MTPYSQAGHGLPIAYNDVFVSYLQTPDHRNFEGIQRTIKHITIECTSSIRWSDYVSTSRGTPTASCLLFGGPR